MRFWKGNHTASIHFEKLDSLQQKTAERVILAPIKKIEVLAGVDVAYVRNSDVAVGAVVLMTFPGMEILEKKTAIGKVKFPYVPGYFTFREWPIIKLVLNLLEGAYDVLFCEGHGLAHPRRCGLGVYLGVHLNKPTIGVAKEPLIGPSRLPPQKRGAYTMVNDQRGAIGVALRTQNESKPLYVSVGHLVTLSQAIDLTLRTALTYRLPEPIRQAHMLARAKAKQIGVV